MEEYSDRFQDGELPEACLTDVRSLSYPTPLNPAPPWQLGANSWRAPSVTAVAVRGKFVEGSSVSDDFFN
jgi:hypothetical protein